MSYSTDEIAEYYDDFVDKVKKDLYQLNPRHEAVYRSICKHIKPDGVAIDVGCGVGALTRILATRGMKVTGIDISPMMIETAKENAWLENSANYIVGDFSDMDLGFEADLIVLSDVLEHIPIGRRNTFIDSVAWHSHDETVVVVNVPDYRLSMYLKKNRPDILQLIDEPFKPGDIINKFMGVGFELIEFKNYGVDCPYQYNDFVFKRNLYTDRAYEKVFKRSI